MPEEKKVIKKKTIKKWKPLAGEKFYFIHETDELTTPFDKQYHVDLNNSTMLVVGEAEAYEPDTDTACNCFRTRKGALKALKTMKAALKFTGRE
jgi:hypothetical protein